MKRPWLPYNRWRDSLRTWPDSMRQSPDSPLQEDRLPDASGMELEYAAKQYTPKQNRRFTYKQFAIAAAIGVQFFFYEHSLNFIYVWIHSALAIIAAIAFVYAASTKPRGAWMWGILLFGLPPLALLFLAYRNATFPFLLAALCMLYLADQFTKHAFYYHTTVPVPATVARNLRFLWSFRFFPLFNKPKGVEFYLLGFFAIGLAFFDWLYRIPHHGTGRFLEYLPPFLVLLGILIAAPLLIEPFAAFLTNRRYVGPLLTVRHFLRAVVSWFSYNRRMVEYPGTFKSPAGIVRARCWMAIATIVLFTSSIIPLFSRHRDRNMTASPGPIHEINSLTIREIPPPPDQSLSPLQRLNRRLYRREQITKGEEDPFPNLNTLQKRDAIPREEATLEPYQQALLKRMTAEERDEYLRGVFESKISSLPIREPTFFDRLLYITETEDIHSPKYRLAYYTIQVSARVPICVYFLISIVLPPLLLLACLFSVSARSIAYSSEQFSSDLPLEDPNSQTAMAAISRVRNSADLREKENLFLGANAQDGTPVIVPRAIFKEHAHLLGDSGSGKTSLGMTSLISQLIEFGDSSLVIIDLKADDLALFEAAREKASEIDERLKKERPDDPEAGYPFRWFTNELHRSTYAFNILRQSCFTSLTPYQRADIITVAMGLQYGTDYGRAYYADANIELLHQAIAARPEATTFTELADVLNDSSSVRINHELKRAASHLHAVISRLASCEAINATDPEKYAPEVLENAIDLADVFRNPQVLYYHLPSLIGTTSSAEIARFVVHMLLASSKAIGPKRKQVYLFIDEFQRITAGNLGIILQTARSMNVGVILANQTMSDLKTPGVDLIPTVEANTRYRQIFAASDLSALRQIVESSGETIMHNRAWSQYLGSIGIMGAALSRTHTETISPRLRPNDVILASDHPLQSVVYVRRGKDYAQYGGFPFVMTSSHLISPQVYEERRIASWPKSLPGTFSASGPEPPQVPVDGDTGYPDDLPDPIIGSTSGSKDSETAPPHGDPLQDSEGESSKSPPDPDDPLYQEWKKLEARRKRQKRRIRPQDKYSNPDSLPSDTEQDPQR